MTIKKAIRITGLDVRRTDTHTFGAFNEGGRVAEATHKKDTIALTMLVDAIYRKRGLEAMAAADLKCVRCGERAPLQRHHDKHRSQGRDDSVENLLPICASCHHKIHSKSRPK